jgi:hypothetical protein
MSPRDASVVVGFLLCMLVATWLMGCATESEGRLSGSDHWADNHIRRSPWN